VTDEQLYRDLLTHLGIIPQLVVMQQRNGAPQREIHLYVDEERMPQVLSWVVRQSSPAIVRVFEGDPPPF